MAAIDPADLVILTDYGEANMGDVTDVDSKCRFAIDADRFCLAWLRAGFLTGSSSADLAIRVDNGRIPKDWRDQASALISSPYDFTLYTIKSAGTGGWSGMFRVADDELRDFMLPRGSSFVLTWTNPGTQAWAVEVALIDAARLRI